jgi:hypothetical protein
MISHGIYVQWVVVLAFLVAEFNSATAFRVFFLTLVWKPRVPSGGCEKKKNCFFLVFLSRRISSNKTKKIKPAQAMNITSKN